MVPFSLLSAEERLVKALVLMITPVELRLWLEFPIVIESIVVRFWKKWARSIEVTLKYDYENNRKIKGIPGALGGDAWYEMNAFRALNQSLGRCIRHKFDWGSILLLDSRYPSKIPLLTKYWYI